MVKSIKCKLSNGDRVKIDLSFYPTYKKYNWYTNDREYVVTKIMKHGKRCTIYLAHLVMDFDPKIDKNLVVDHKFQIVKDNRKKKLRIVTRSINGKNRKKTTSNTNILGIHFHETKQCYVVSYTINNIHETESFYFGKKKTRQNAYKEAYDFNNHIRTTDPSYREAYCLDDDVSSSGSSIDESDYERKITTPILKRTNTSGYNNIRDQSIYKRWVVDFHNENGKPVRTYFTYIPRSKDTKEEAFEKALRFRDKMSIYNPKYKTKSVSYKDMDEYDGTDTNNDEEDRLSIKSYGNTNIENINESDSDTISMDEEEIQKEIEISINQGSLNSIHDGVYLDLETNSYTVSYIKNGMLEQEYFYFGTGHKNEWWAAKLLAENFNDLKR